MENWYLHHLEKKEGNHAKTLLPRIMFSPAAKPFYLILYIYIGTPDCTFEVTYSKFKKYTQGTRRPRH